MEVLLAKHKAYMRSEIDTKRRAEQRKDFTISQPPGPSYHGGTIALTVINPIPLSGK